MKKIDYSFAECYFCKSVLVSYGHCSNNQCKEENSYFAGEDIINFKIKEYIFEYWFFRKNFEELRIFKNEKLLININSYIFINQDNYLNVIDKLQSLLIFK